MRPPIEYISKENNKNLVIFIHGFTSDSKTWSNSKEQTLPQMLLEEDLIKENFDMCYFNYFTKLADFKRARLAKALVNKIFGNSSNIKKNIGIKGISEHLKSSVDVYCSEYENIIIIAHSMGGLISKAYILEELQEIGESNVKLFLSLAVPHKGSDWANVAGKLSRENPQILELKPLSNFLDEINNDWIQQKNVLPKTIYYYGQYDEIVEEKNAISFQAEKQLKVACNCDHFNICKPETKESIVYNGLKRDLYSFFKELEYAEGIKSKDFADDGKLDDEIFVLKLLISDVHQVLIYDAKQTFFNAEYMIKSITNKGHSLDELEELYRKIERLYRINFAKFVDGKLGSSNDLVSTIFEEIIDRDRGYLKTAIPLIKADEKTGMLHQLVNNLDKDIWWAREQSIRDVDEFRRVRDKR